MACQLTLVLWQYLRLAAENVNNGVYETVEQPLVTNQENVQQEDNVPPVNNTTE